MGLEARNTMRIAALEQHVPQMGTRIEVIDERTSIILALVQELKDDLKESSTESQKLAISHAENMVRWQMYEKAKESMERDIDDVSALARANQLTLAKSLLLGGGGGVVGAVVTSLIMSFFNKP